MKNLGDIIVGIWSWLYQFDSSEKVKIYWFSVLSIAKEK